MDTLKLKNSHKNAGDPHLTIGSYAKRGKDITRV